MRLAIKSFLFAASAFTLLASPALADVHVRVAVSPDSLPQCSQGHVLLAVGNSGTQRIMARVCFALVRNDSVLIGPACGRVPLAAGETRRREFTLLIPPSMPVGNYAIVARAMASDSTSDRAAAPFTVTPGNRANCVHTSTDSVSPESALLNGVIQGSGFQVDVVTPARRASTWGDLKLRYH